MPETADVMVIRSGLPFVAVHAQELALAVMVKVPETPLGSAWMVNGFRV